MVLKLPTGCKHPCARRMYGEGWGMGDVAVRPSTPQSTPCCWQTLLNWLLSAKSVSFRDSLKVRRAVCSFPGFGKRPLVPGFKGCSIRSPTQDLTDNTISVGQVPACCRIGRSKTFSACCCSIRILESKKQGQSFVETAVSILKRVGQSKLVASSQHSWSSLRGMKWHNPQAILDQSYYM